MGDKRQIDRMPTKKEYHQLGVKEGSRRCAVPNSKLFVNRINLRFDMIPVETIHSSPPGLAFYSPSRDR